MIVVMLPSQMRHLLFPAALLAYLMSATSCCDSCSQLDVGLLPLSRNVSQAVQAEFQQVGGATPVISCSWTLSEPSRGYSWNCTRDRNGKTDGYTGSHYLYNLSDPTKSWTIRLTGPSGTQTLTRTARADSGEEWPSFSCSCDLYTLFVGVDDLKSVGAVQGLDAPIDAGVDAADASGE